MDAAFTVFERAGDRSRPFLAILAFYVLAAFIVFLPMGAMMVSDLSRGVWPGSEAPQRWSALAQLVGFLMWPIAAMAQAALLRWMLRGSPGGWWLGVRFGAEELKLMVIHVLIGIAAIIVIVTAIIAAVIMGALASWAGSGAAAAAVVAIAALWGVGATLYVLVRFSPAPALTIAQGGFPFFEAWRISQGYAAALFGAHLVRLVLMLALAAAVMLGVTVVGLALLAPVLGQTMGAAFGDLRAAPPYAWTAGGVLFVLWLALSACLEFLQIAMSAGIGVRLLETRRAAVAPAADSR